MINYNLDTCVNIIYLETLLLFEWTESKSLKMCTIQELNVNRKRILYFYFSNNEEPEPTYY